MSTFSSLQAELDRCRALDPEGPLKEAAIEALEEQIRRTPHDNWQFRFVLPGSEDEAAMLDWGWESTGYEEWHGGKLMVQLKKWFV